MPNLQGTNYSDVSIKLWCCKQLYLEEVDTVQDSTTFWCCTPYCIFPVRAGVKTWFKYCHVLYNNQNLLMTPRCVKLNWNQIWPSDCEFT